jgi:MioC protein
LPLDITILVGTMTGTAQLVAQELELRIDDGETRAQARLMDNLDATVFQGGGLFLICTSTYGQGDVPDNARQLYQSLQDARPDLSPVRYGGRRFDRVLSELGARRIGEILLHDASAGTMPEEVAAEWIEGWVTLCRERISTQESA